MIKGRRIAVKGSNMVGTIVKLGEATPDPQNEVDPWGWVQFDGENTSYPFDLENLYALDGEDLI